jgi:beta-glucosidase
MHGTQGSQTDDARGAGHHFPSDFVWGAATSAFQIEGATATDGRGPSIWDTFCATPGMIVDASDGSRACESHARWAEDLDLIRSLGFGAYRFSVAWPRVMPDGTGKVNAAGLDHYERLVDGMLARSLAPYATLYHWDLPQALEDRGGWRSRDTAFAFADYAAAVADRLGDRVASYATLNEPWCSAFLGYGSGEHAPGLRDAAAVQRAVHHLLLAHGLALPRLRAAAPRAEHGIVLNFTPAYPHRPGDARDLEAVRRHDVANHQVFLGPLLDGTYPNEVHANAVGAGYPVEDGDMGLIAAPLDFLGVNYYTRCIVSDDGGGRWPGTATFHADGAAHTAMGWEVYPDGLRDLLITLHHRTHLPLFVTENGAAFDDQVRDDTGVVVDEDRWRYLTDHLAAVAQARAAGADVRGYFAWSLLDNFEWAHGYTKRFGIVHVDFETQQRTPKRSALRLQDVMRTPAVAREAPAEGQPASGV